MGTSFKKKLEYVILYMQFVYPLDKNLFSSVHVIRTELEFERDRKTEYLKKHSQI